MRHHSDTTEESAYTASFDGHWKGEIKSATDSELDKAVCGDGRVQLYIHGRDVIGNIQAAEGDVYDIRGRITSDRRIDAQLFAGESDDGSFTGFLRV